MFNSAKMGHKNVYTTLPLQKLNEKKRRNSSSKRWNKKK
jgi:hypothetical protein